MRRPLLVALVAVLLVAADDAKKDAENIQGIWTVVSAERDGKKMPEKETKNVKVTFKDGVMSVSREARDEKAGYKLDPAKKPKTIDFTPDQDKKEKPALGIYELDGDNLKLCWSKEGGARPTEFVSKADSDVMLIVLKREKK